MTRILVTGATGNVSSKVVRDLCERGLPVRAFVRDRRRGRSVLGDDVELAVGDLSARETIDAAMEGVAQVFLCTPNHPEQLERERAVIDAAAAAGVRRIVKLSSVGTAIGSPSKLWDCHARIERHLLGSGVPASILRSSFFMSNVDASAPTLFAPAAGARIAMVDTADVAAAAAAILADGGRETGIRLLTGPEALTFDDVARTLSAVTGSAVEFVAVPDDAAVRAMIAQGVPAWLAEGIAANFALLREGIAARTTGDVRELTGREPRSFQLWARAGLAPLEVSHA
jgi:uncharacterized protein YbjT (DUF2867 family)